MTMTTMTRLTHDAIDVNALLQAVHSPHAGAVALFLGTVRDLTGDEITESLEYEAYVPMAEAKIADILAEARQLWSLEHAAAIHRLGRLKVGEISVAVAVSSAHRPEAFAACRYVIDRLKEVVPIWKKDIPPGGGGAWKES